MRGPLLALGSIFAAFGGVMGWLLWDSSVNHGFEFGYFGQFNRVSRAARAVPGVTMINSWYHGDISLEEFELTLSASGKPVTLFFSESDTVRTMSHEAAIAALKQRIEGESVSAE